MADHMIDLKPGSSDAVAGGDSGATPEVQSQAFLPLPAKRTKRLKYRPSVNAPEEREGRNWSRGILVFVTVSVVASVSLWFALWHIPGLSPWPFFAPDTKGHNLAGELSLLWVLHFFPMDPFNGYDWTSVRLWLNHHGILRSFERILALSLGSGLVSGILAFLWASRGRLKKVHVSGKRVFNSVVEANRELRGEIAKSGQGISIHPDVPISRDRETRHFFVLGAIGSGKTQVIWNILQSILHRMRSGPEDRLILYDNKSDMTSGLPVSDSEMILLAPWDARTWAWDVGKDIENASDAATFAERLIPESKDKFWSEAPRQIVKACIQHLQATHGTAWSWKDLSRALNSQETILGAVMLYAPNLAPVFVGTGGGPTSTGASLLSSMNAFTGSIDDLCRAWDNTDPFTGKEIEPGRVIPRVSLREWALTPIVQRRVIILQGNKRYLTLERAYIQTIISAFGAIMNSPEMPDSKTRRIWFLLDEFPQLGRLENFAQYLEVGRSKGLCVLLGLQDLSQLREIYGRETADVWAAICGTYIVCRSQGVETVRWLTQFFGERSVRSRRVSLTNTEKGPRKTITEVVESEPVVTGHDLNALGDNRGRCPGILAILSLNTGHGVYRLVWPYVTLPKVRENQIPAGWTTASPKPAPISPEGRRESGRTKRRGKSGEKKSEEDPSTDSNNI
ncbi:MAG: type IV secretion system DNA-binding domain-containing protein [Leptospirales bacterium]